MIHFIQHIFHIFLNWSGSSNPSGNQYGFFSGFGSDLAEFAIVGALIGAYKHHNCAVPRCPRFGHHEVKGTHYKTCHKHATKAWHDKLKQDHSEEFPEQHAFLNDLNDKPEPITVLPPPTPIVRLRVKQ